MPFESEAAALCLAAKHFRTLTCDYGISYTMSADDQTTYWLVVLEDQVSSDGMQCPIEYFAVCKNTGETFKKLGDIKCAS